jgi:hypothetical protein
MLDNTEKIFTYSTSTMAEKMDSQAMHLNIISDSVILLIHVELKTHVAGKVARKEKSCWERANLANPMSCDVLAENKIIKQIRRIREKLTTRLANLSRRYQPQRGGAFI